MAVIGGLLAVIGGIVMGVASKKLQYATDVNELTNAMMGLSSLDDTSAAMRSATSLGHLGLGMLIFGLALLLCGIVVAALRRPVRATP